LLTYNVTEAKTVGLTRTKMRGKNAIQAIPNKTVFVIRVKPVLL
jgi:hypothetical protein